MDFKRRKIIQLEVAQRGRFAFRDYNMERKAIWHTNHYINLNLKSQSLHVDSTARMNRIYEIEAPGTRDEVLGEERCI
jgi:hypothetical protein